MRFMLCITDNCDFILYLHFGLIVTKPANSQLPYLILFFLYKIGAHLATPDLTSVDVN